MSPLWRDEVGVHLSPHAVCLVRTGRGLRPAIKHQMTRTLEPSASGAWQEALSCLDALLSQSEWQARIRAVVSDQWARYAMVPWVSEISDEGEQLSHAKQVLASLYGDPVAEWDVRLSDEPPERPRVACTVPRTLVAEIRALCAKHGLPLVSLQSQLIAAWHSCRAQLAEVSGWFVSVDRGSLAAAHIGERGWDRVHNVRIGSEWARELKRLQTFGRIACTRPEDGHVYVDAPRSWQIVAGPAGQDLHWLEDDSGATTTIQHLCRIRRLAA